MHLITDAFDDSAFREKKIDFTNSLALEVKSKGNFMLEVKE